MTTFFFLMKNVQKIQFIERTNLIVVRIYSQATEAHWKKTDTFYSPWAKGYMRNENDASHVQENSYTTLSETWLSSPSVWKCCNENFLFHEGIYDEKLIRNVPLFSLHNRPKHIQLLPFIFLTYRTEHVFIELLIVPYYSSA